MAKYNNLENLIQAAGCGGSEIAASEVSAGLDCKNYEDAILIISTLTLAAGYVGTVTIEHSDDNAVSDAYAAVTGASVTIADTDDDSTLYAKLRLNTANMKRWIRATLDIATAAGPTAVTLVAYNKGGSLPVESPRTLQFDVNLGVV